MGGRAAEGGGGRAAHGSARRERFAVLLGSPSCPAQTSSSPLLLPTLSQSSCAASFEKPSLVSLMEAALPLQACNTPHRGDAKSVCLLVHMCHPSPRTRLQARGTGAALLTVPRAQPAASRWPPVVEEGFCRLQDLPTHLRGGEPEAWAPTNPTQWHPRLRPLLGSLLLCCKVLGLGKKFLARLWLFISSVFFW